ncbi:hypothetical protein BFP70_16080 [Thioclava sp. SK-1]|uniref:hypothetical protein n=1 Tax=Thioclava sp. SK-1 TaxID=1889770 RepID=UPI00082425A5|nr:hypothetical protein [Thioclava sp. SK-1]OCX60983.1 hypothetical protein BFP70_16080 [Thioclava sp. SK-1]
MTRPYIILVIIVVLTVVGDYALKLAAGKTQPFISMWFVSGAVLYAATAMGWVMLMQTHNLAQIGALYSSVTILALTAVGYFAFGETLTVKQCCGLIAALLAVYLVEA